MTQKRCLWTGDTESAAVLLHLLAALSRCILSPRGAVAAGGGGDADCEWRNKKRRTHKEKQKKKERMRGNCFL